MPAASASSSGAPSIAARLDRLPITRLHLIATGIIGLGLFFDAYENFLAGTISAVLKQDFGMSGATLSWVLASAFIGQFLGALFMGRLADAVGRRPAFMINLGLYSLASLAGAFSPDATFLVITRFIAGVGIGGEYALADSYLSDLMPKARRGQFIAWAYTISFLAVPAVGFLARWLTPLQPWGIDGWRWLFVIGAVGSLVVWLLRTGLPESPRWLEAHGQPERAEKITRKLEERAVAEGHVLAEPDAGLAPPSLQKVSVSRLFRAPYTRRTIMLWLMFALEVFGYYGFGTVAPLVLVSKGFDVTHSLTFVALSYLGYPLGSALAVPIIERVERKHLVISTAAAMAGFGLWFGFAGSPVTIVIAGFLYSCASNMFSNAIHVYLADSYPTAIRGTAAGAAYSLSKLVTAFLPFLLLPLLDARGGATVFAVVAGAMVALMVVVAVLGHRSTGRSADEV